MMTLVARRAVIKEAEKVVPKVVLREVLEVAKEEPHVMYLRMGLMSLWPLRLFKQRLAVMSSGSHRRKAARGAHSKQRSRDLPDHHRKGAIKARLHQKKA